MDGLRCGLSVLSYSMVSLEPNPIYIYIYLCVCVCCSGTANCYGCRSFLLNKVVTSMVVVGRSRRGGEEWAGVEKKGAN